MRSLILFTIIGISLLAACGQSDAETDQNTPEQTISVTELADNDTNTDGGADVTAVVETPLGIRKGNPDASVVLVEYFSPTCGACKQFHDDLMPMILSEYVDTGKVLFEYRDYPLNQVDLASYTLARCTGSDEGYINFMDDFFENQAGIREAYGAGAGKAALETIAARHGIEGEEAFNACIADEDIRKAVEAAALSGREAGVLGTPTFLVNDTLYRYQSVYSSAQMRDVLDAAIEGMDSEGQDLSSDPQE